MSLGAGTGVRVSGSPSMAGLGTPDLHQKSHTHNTEAFWPDQEPSGQTGNILGFSLFSWPSTNLLFRSDQVEWVIFSTDQGPCTIPDM